MGCPAVVSVLTPARLAEGCDLRKVIAGVIQGEALLVGAARDAAGAPVSAPGRCGFGMRWSG
jgi:hypothetical protein